MTKRLPPLPALHPFALHGEVLPLAKAARASGHTPTRPFGGWLMTYGKLGPDGGVVPTVDRDGHTVEAARELGRIDWSPYLKGGRWNDTHKEDVIVGLPSSLEFHDGTTELSKAHGKVGFWTAGHLFDRDDPASWTAYGDYEPTEQELQRADHFWTLSRMLKGMPRPLGFSAHGSMALSPCGSRIIWCQVRQAAVCETPKNPDATAEALVKGGPLEVLRKGMVGRKACGACTCPPWACEGLRKAKMGIPSQPALSSGGDGMPTLPGVDEMSEPDPSQVAGSFTPTGNKQLDVLLQALMRSYFVDQATAQRWVRRWFHRRGTAARSQLKEARRG